MQTKVLVRFVLDDHAPVVVGDVLERAADLPDDAAGVVDEDVDGADPGDERVDLVGVGHVDGVLVAPVDGGPVLCERARDRGADPVRRAGDDRDPSREVGAHAPPPVVEQLANLLDAGLPDAEHVVVGPDVEPAE